MCYSAQVNAEFKKLVRATGSDMDIDSYVKMLWWKQGLAPEAAQGAAGLERDILAHGPPEVAEMIRQRDA